MIDPYHAHPVAPPVDPEVGGTGICSEDGHQLDAHGDCPLCGLSFVAYPQYGSTVQRSTDMSA